VAYNFYGMDREQMYLMPPSLKEWLPEGDLAWFLLDAVRQMDLDEFYEGYREDGKGATAYHPEMLVGLLLYAYCQGVLSSRKIERMCEVDVACRVVTANLKPDHSSIARFRQEHEKGLEKVFVKVLRLCKEAGLVKVGMVALDGTKMKGNASLEANRTKESLEKEIRRMLEGAREVDEEEDRKYGKDKRGDELPEGLRRPVERLKRLKECQERLEKEAKEAMEAQVLKIEERAQKEKESGERMRGRKPLEPEEVVDQEAKANVTDPESRIMKTRQGHVQGYNAQVVVTKEQIVVACAVTQEENDTQQLKPMMELLRRNLREIGMEKTVDHFLTDAGYGPTKTLGEVEKDEETEYWINTRKDWKRRKALREEGPPRGRIPQGWGPKERMERKLMTKEGQERYRWRSQMVEPVFGQIKHNRKCDRFQRRGIQAGDSEWAFICASHNLLKLWRSGKAPWVKKAA